MRRFFLLVFFALLVVFTLSACAGKSAPDTASLSPEQIAYPPSADMSSPSQDPKAAVNLASFSGTWEGILGEPFGYKVILDCSTDVLPWKATVSFVADTWNYYYIETNHTIENDALKLWWNDEANRAIITFTFTNDGDLVGVLSQYGDTASATLIKTSDIAAREPSQIKPQENLTNLLSENADFNRADCVSVDFQYIMENEKLDELRETYDLDAIAGEGDSQTKALNLLNWLGTHTSHNGYFDNHVAKNALALLEYTYDKDAQNGVNCYNLSIILTEACLSVGIQARSLWLYPENPNDMDKHVVTMAYIPESEKWIMLDPSFNSYLSDVDGNVLSPFEIRQKLADKEQMHLNQNAKIDYMDYANYLAKDMFYFSSIQTTKFGVFDESAADNPMIYLGPANFDLNEWNITNLYFINENVSDSLTSEELAQREETLRKRKYIFATPESFWGNAD